MAFNLIDGQFVDGGSGGSESYLSLGANGGSVADLTPWYGYAGTAGSNPTSPFVESSSLGISRNTTAPISGSGDIRFSKPASNEQGKGRWLPFTIENRHLGRVLQVTFDARLASGTYATGDLRASFIQDPSGTPVTIEPVNTAIQLGIIGQTVKVIATFQTHITVKDYALAIHIASESAVAYAVDFNNFRVWEPIANYGAIITDWQSYTPSVNGSTTSSNLCFWRRVGSSVEIRGRIRFSSVPASTFRIELPSGLTVSSSTTITNQQVGHAYRTNTLTQWGIALRATSGNAFCEGSFQDYTGIRDYDTNFNVNANFNSTDGVTFFASVPIQGWGSNLALSSDAGDGRLVALETGGSSLSGGSGSGVIIVFPTVIRDTHGVYNNATGRYTVPVSGMYRVSYGLFASVSNVNIHLYKNGAISKRIGFTVSGITNATGSASTFCNVGDILDLRPEGNLGSMSAGEMSIERISAGSQILTSGETVACSYYSAATQTSLTAQINFGTKVYDTHGAVTTGANWKFTAPMAGKYLVTGYIATAVSESILVYKNGSVDAIFCYTSNDGNQTGNGSFQIDLLQGDTIDLRPAATENVLGSTSASSKDRSRIEISRIGI